MLLREVAYGINVGFNRVVINPRTRFDYAYSVGGTQVAHSAMGVTFRLPGDGSPKAVEVHQVKPDAGWAVVCSSASGGTQRQQAGSDDNAVLAFTAPVGPAWTCACTCTD